MDEGKAVGPRPSWWSRFRHGDGDASPSEDAARSDVAPSGGQRPRHGEDPYATPPYGAPGPWAPAPPVQHPAVSAGAAAASPAASSVPPPTGTPAEGTPTGGTPAHGTPTGATPAHGTPTGPGGLPGFDPWAPPPAHGTAGGPVAPAARPAARWPLLLSVALLALVAGCLGGAIGSYVERHNLVGAVELPQAPADDGERDPHSTAGIAKATLPGVVTLRVRGATEAGTGTGFVLDRRGHILTNHHVVEPALHGGQVQVTFHSGQTVAATVVGTDSSYDLAVVRVTGVSGLHPLPLGNSDSVRVGDPVVAIGAPYDLEGTVTAGIISATERPITAGGEGGTDVSYVNALQTDAPINPGNSGGPLVDARGRVIGVNSAIRGPDQSEGGAFGSVGLGFAIPVNQAKRVAEELINTGRASHPVIGVRLDTRFTGTGARVGNPVDDAPAVLPGGPADRAGVRDGDVITEVDGTPVAGPEELIVKIRDHRPGDRLTLTVARGDRERQVEVVLDAATDG